MSDTAVFWDAEWLSAPGAMDRMWCGAADPDPVVVQIGAVALSLAKGFALGKSIDILIRPTGRDGEPIRLDPWFASFTGLSDARLEAEGLSLADGLARFADFVGDAPVYSWGKDEMMVMGISAYLSGLDPPLPVQRFHHAGELLIAAGYPAETFNHVRSQTLAEFVGLPQRAGQAHDGLFDATEVARSIAHLLRTGQLSAADVRRPVAPA